MGKWVEYFTVLCAVLAFLGIAQVLESVAKPQFGPKSALSSPDGELKLAFRQARRLRSISDFSQIAYTHSHMFDLRKTEPALKSSNLDCEAGFATDSFKKESTFHRDPLIASSTYMGPKQRLPGNPQLIRVEILVHDSPDESGLQIDRVYFDGTNIPLQPRDIHGNRGGASFQKPPGTYKLRWVVNRDHLIWPRNLPHEEIIVLSPRDQWVQVSIEGDTASIR